MHPPIIKNAPGRLDNYARRLLDVQEELGQIGKEFDDSADRIRKIAEDPHRSSVISTELKRQGITGFRAFHLDSEGIAILNLLNLVVSFLELEGSASPGIDANKLEKMKGYILRVEPVFMETLNKMDPYKAINTTDALKDL